MSFKIVYIENGIKLTLVSERGYLTYRLTIDNHPVDLNKFDGRMDIIEVFSKKNILFLLELIKEYLNKKN